MTLEEASRERNPFLEAVGSITLAGGMLDNHLRTLLGSLAHEPTLLAHANAESTDRLIDLCRLALRMQAIPKDEAAEVNKCLDLARDLKNKRNQVVHSIFFHQEDGEIQAMKPVKKTIGMSGTAITVSEMEETAAQIQELCLELFRTGWNATAHRSGMDKF
ncbi:hypothetical protein [Streptomyces sp. CA-111067]|uniref:hypothetical protein n=1 Tax=Streptomyces sp. CA-111067 TaxID=3240046 RepID=UPI003D98BC87